MAGLIHLPGVAGCDEAGRGPLAGPVVCAAVILPKGFDIRGLNDSKKLTLAQRTKAEAKIKAKADWAIAVIEHDEIDRINILEASLLGMSRALDDLAGEPDVALIDGNHLPRSARCKCEAQIKGDAAYACIAAASILAKNARDRIMTTLHERFPVYGFDTNFGYPTPDHLSALKIHGPCAYHRTTYAPVADWINQPRLDFGDEAVVTTVTKNLVKA